MATRDSLTRPDELEDPWFEPTEEELVLIEYADAPQRALGMPIALVSFALAISVFLSVA